MWCWIYLFTTGFDRRHRLNEKVTYNNKTKSHFEKIMNIKTKEKKTADFNEWIKKSTTIVYAMNNIVTKKKKIQL